MAVMKMTSVTIAGAVYDFERIVSRYVIGREIHLENAMTSLSGSSKKLMPFTEDGQYGQIAKSITEILSYANFAPKEDESGYEDTPKDEMLEDVREISDKLEEGKNAVLNIQKQIEENKIIIKQLETLSDMDIELEKLFNLEFMMMRFGKLPKTSYQTLNVYLEELETIFIKAFEDDKHIWGMYFMPAVIKEQVDAVFSSLYFERLHFPESVKGTPLTAIKNLNEANFEFEEEIKSIRADLRKLIQNNYYRLSDYYRTTSRYAEFSDIRKKAAHSEEFFFVVGWMAEKDAKNLQKEVEEDETVLFISEKPEEAKISDKPPTKLKNPRLLKPFEFFVRMYGMPSYDEVDPTPIVAISYIILFGIMFGDVGQSFIFFIAGLILYLKKKIDLAAIVSMVGVSGTIFGFVYGSIFGNETLLAGIRLIEPMHQIGFMLGGAVGIGIFVILACMVVNIINAVKQKNWGKLLFSQNGLAGMVFYGAMLVLAGSSFLFTELAISKNLLMAFLIITVIMMFMQEPLSKLVEKKKDWMPKNGMFFVESFFEMFDVLLSFITNTISFLRVGAFAIIHVGMMMVVTVLAEKSSGAGNIITMIIGNILVMGLEGLIVGIQVLRLEYYEMFSRYYIGSGRAFKSMTKDTK